MLKNIKAKKVLQFIIKTYLKESKYLSLLRHNKQLQNLLDISLQDYKSFFSIEILLKPKKQLKNEENYFIYINSNNLSTVQKSSYYHIYFNENKEETKRDYITKEDKV